MTSDTMPMLAKVARRVQDDRVLGLIKQFLKSTGKKGIPQGSPLSPLLANVALNDLDHILGRGYGYLTYVRYLDDMVVLTFDSRRHTFCASMVLPTPLGPRKRTFSRRSTKPKPRTFSHRARSILRGWLQSKRSIVVCAPTVAILVRVARLRASR